MSARCMITHLRAARVILAAEPVRKITTGKHSHHLGHLCETLPERYCAGTDSGLSVYDRICHLADECWQRYNITWHLLLELRWVFSFGPVVDGKGSDYSRRHSTLPSSESCRKAWPSKRLLQPAIVPRLCFVNKLVSIVQSAEDIQANFVSNGSTTFVSEATSIWYLSSFIISLFGSVIVVFPRGSILGCGEMMGNGGTLSPWPVPGCPQIPHILSSQALVYRGCIPGVRRLSGAVGQQWSEHHGDSTARHDNSLDTTLHSRPRAS